MSQVPFVAHLRGRAHRRLPVREWVHRSKNPKCTGALRLFSTGGGGLEGQVVRCGYDAKNKRDERQGCGASRSLQGITMARPPRRRRRGKHRPHPGPSRTRRPLPAAQAPVRGCMRWTGRATSPSVVPCELPATSTSRGSSHRSSCHSKVGAVSGAMRELLKRADVESRSCEVVHSFAGADATAAKIRKRLPPRAVRLIHATSELLAAYRDRFGIGAERPRPGTTARTI